MRKIAMTLVMAAMLSAVGCASIPAPAGVTFIVVRHAEKATDDPHDPSLNPAGRARAAALATQLKATPLTAAYATAYRRTQQTAAPVAAAHGIAVRTYDAAQPAAEFAMRLRRDHAGGTVLVVGHSNTVSDIVSALCACSVAPIDEGSYGGRYDVRIDSEDRATLTQGRY